MLICFWLKKRNDWKILPVLAQHVDPLWTFGGFLSSGFYVFYYLFLSLWVTFFSRLASLVLWHCCAFLRSFVCLHPHYFQLSCISADINTEPFHLIAKYQLLIRGSKEKKTIERDRKGVALWEVFINCCVSIFVEDCRCPRINLCISVAAAMEIEGFWLCFCLFLPIKIAMKILIITRRDQKKFSQLKKSLEFGLKLSLLLFFCCCCREGSLLWAEIH